MSDAKKKAGMLRGQVKDLKRTRDAYTKDMAISDRDDNKFDTKSGPFERMMKGSAARKASSGIIDRERTIARLESSKDRSKRSATYRLAQMKADAKARKRKIIEPDMRGVNASKRNRKIIEPDMRGVKASKKGKK